MDLLNSAVRLLDIAARRFPDRPAVEDDTGTITYREYREKSLSVASALLGDGRSERGPVIVYLPKSTAALICFMGSMYSGSPYVPVDAEIPIQRLEKIIANVEPAHIITNSALAANLEDLPQSIRVEMDSDLLACPPDEAAVEAAVGRVIDTDPIYIMYTSGSTGVPKGVAVPHRGVVDYAQWVVETFGYDEHTVMANQAAFYFDNSIFDIYGTLLCGGKLVLIPDSLIMVPSKLPAFLEERQVTSIFWVPTVMIHVANSGALARHPMPRLTTVAFCGEVMPNLQLNIWRREHPDCLYANLYGPTEISDVCTYYIVDREFQDHDPLPIGKACENMRVMILTEENKLAEPGEQGELCVAGSGVALGYWNAPEISDKVFVPNPANPRFSERIYRTGDLAYVDERGLIMFLGRRDSQIKFKGNRIELGDIETAAVCIEGVNSACALFDGDRQEIVLFLETEREFLLRKFNMQLKAYVPKYMLVQKLVTMAAFPHTPNGKIDRVALRRRLDQ